MRHDTSVPYLNFGVQLVGTTSPPQTLTLTNTGDASLNITAIRVGIPPVIFMAMRDGVSDVPSAGLPEEQPLEFAQTNNCGSSVAPAASCTINVTFTPIDRGLREQYLIFDSDSAGSLQAVPLMGTGIAPLVSLSANSMSFVDQLVDTISAAQSVTVTNSGDAPLSVASVTVTGDFAVSSQDCTANSIGPGSNCAIIVSFAPTVAGIRNGTLTVTSDALGSPHTVQLSGTGTDFALNIQSGGSTSATVNAGQTATYNLQIAPTGLSGTVTLGCAWSSQQPRGTNCTVSPTSASLDGTNAAPFSVSVSTTARSLAVPQPDSWPPWSAPVRGVPLAVLLFVLLTLITIALPRRRRVYVGLAASMLLVVIWAACGGGGGGGGGGGTPQPQVGTPAGNYSLTITGTASGVSRSTTLTLKVN